MLFLIIFFSLIDYSLSALNISLYIELEKIANIHKNKKHGRLFMQQSVSQSRKQQHNIKCLLSLLELYRVTREKCNFERGKKKIVKQTALVSS